VREDSSVSLRCSAIGFPKPDIKWRREDGQAFNMQSNGETKVTKKGEFEIKKKLRKQYFII
jgi:hypothetical protein